MIFHAFIEHMHWTYKVMVEKVSEANLESSQWNKMEVRLKLKTLKHCQDAIYFTSFVLCYMCTVFYFLEMLSTVEEWG